MMDPASDPNARYARGEISREEWQRLRSPTTATAMPAAPPPQPRASSTRLPVIVVVLLIAAVATAGVLFVLAGSPGLTRTPSYGSARQLQPSDLATLNASATQGVAFAVNDTLWFPRGTVHLVVYASPSAHDMAFVIQGLVNPTIHVSAGSTVTVTAVNLDADVYHNWALSSTGPPYGSMPMMGPGMMVQMQMLAPSSTSGFWSQQVTFAPAAGSLWYLCAVAGHASSGMYGALDVG